VAFELVTVPDLVATLAHVQGSAISLTSRNAGESWMRVKKLESLSTSWSWRASVDARSNRNPSTCISSNQ